MTLVGLFTFARSIRIACDGYWTPLSGMCYVFQDCSLTLFQGTDSPCVRAKNPVVLGKTADSEIVLVLLSRGLADPRLSECLSKKRGVF